MEDKGGSPFSESNLISVQLSKIVFGWDTYTRKVARVICELTPEERQTTVEVMSAFLSKGRPPKAVRLRFQMVRDLANLSPDAIDKLLQLLPEENPK